MTNSWSLLYDEMYSFNNDGRSLGDDRPIFDDDVIDFGDTLNINMPTSSMSNDIINFTMSENEDGTLNLSKEIVNSNIPGGMGDDHISLSLSNNNGFWKYNEDVILKEIREYLGSTYRSHYTSQESKTQTLDLIESIGDAEPFCRSNAIKYLSRFGKKNGKSKQDILKAIHYCILLYHFAGLCNENTQPYETF